jgi:chorismate-pyruvate lyase
LPVTASGPVDLQRWLRDSSGTVTQLLEHLTGDVLSAEVIAQSPTQSGADAVVDGALTPATGQQLTRRVALLRGSPSGLPYVYAESAFVPDRLPEPVRRRLADTRDPIGRVLVAHALPMAREALPSPEPPPPTDAVAVATAGTSEIVWARAYRLLVDGAPVFAIREWFLGTVLDALDRSRAT